MMYQKMPLRFVEIGKQFRPATSHVYPPFKKGRYLEEFCYEKLYSKKAFYLKSQIVNRI